MLSKSELQVLNYLVKSGKAAPTEIAREVGVHQRTVYNILDGLIDVGLLVEQRGEKNQRNVKPADDPVVEAYRSLVIGAGHVEWEELLSPSTLRVLWFLGGQCRIAEIADRLHVTRAAVHKAIDPLKGRAILIRRGREWTIAENLTSVVRFARELASKKHRQQARNIADSAVIAWNDPLRALVRVQRRDDTESLLDAPEWEVTGLGRFEEYGLKFFLANEPEFWFGPRDSLSIEELICHTLLLDAGSRKLSYTMLLIDSENVDTGDLKSVARWYGLEHTVTVLSRAVDGDFTESDRLQIPSEREYESLKTQYGVE